MHKFWSNLALQLGKRAGLVTVILILVTLTLAMGIPKLQFATGQDSYLNKSDTVYKDNVKYQELFGGQAMIVLFTMDKGHTVDELFSPHNQQAIATASDELRRNPGVEAVVSPITAAQFSDNLVQRSWDHPTDPTPEPDATATVAGHILNDALASESPGSKAQQVRLNDTTETLTRLGEVPDNRTLDNPEWVKFLLYDNTGAVRKALRVSFFDRTHAQMIVRLKGNADIETEGKGSVAVQKAWENRTIEGATVTVTGAPVLLKDINDYLRGGMLTLGGIAVVIMVIILLVLFDVRWRLLPLGVILIGVTWAFGLAGYLGIPLTLVTISGLPVMLGIGIDYAIQMHARVEEEVVIDREEHPIQETARNLGPALLVVTFDAIFAFAALRFAKVPMIREFGLLLAVGIAAICLCSIIVPLAALGIREYKSPTKGRDFREGTLGRLVVRLGHVPPRLAPVLAVASILIFIGGILVEGKLVLQTDPVQWVNQSSQGIKDVHTLERQTGASSELGVFIRSDHPFSNETVAFVHNFTQQTLDRYPTKLLAANSIVTPVSYLTELAGASDIVPTGEQVRKTYLAAPPDVKKFTVDVKAGAHNVVFLTRPASLEERAVVVDGINNEYHKNPAVIAAVEKKYGVSATPSGLAVVGVGLLKNLEANRVLLTYLAILFVFLFLSVRLRSVIRALLSLVPVLIAVGTASLVAYAFSLKLSPMTAVGGPLVVAACTEFTSLILLRFVEERRRGLTPHAAVDVAAARTGRAFIVSGLTAISGVAVLATSSLPLLRDFGQIVAMNVFVALLSALVILPPILAWADHRNWVSRGLVDPEILERARHTHDTTGENVTGAT